MKPTTEDLQNTKRIKRMYYFSIFSGIVSIITLVSRLSSDNKIELETAPVYYTDLEWHIGPWPKSSNLLPLEKVSEQENISREELESLIKQKKITPEPLPIRVTYTDYGFAKNYKIEK